MQPPPTLVRVNFQGLGGGGLLNVPVINVTFCTLFETLLGLRTSKSIENKTTCKWKKDLFYRIDLNQSVNEGNYKIKPYILLPGYR